MPKLTHCVTNSIPCHMMECSLFITNLVFVFFLAVLSSAEGKSANTKDVGEPLILTPYITSGELEKARHLSKVTVSGWSGHSGFFTVDEKCGANLFFWFIKAKNNSANAPLFLWLNGGPGSTSLVGLFEEIGPLKYTEKKGLEHRDTTWNFNNNVLYIDQPVGCGFSFPKNNCLVETVEASTKQLYSAMVQFCKIFPEYQKNKLYLSGQSFAGHYIPALGAHIYSMNQKPGVEVIMNLAGLAVGNPGTLLSCLSYGEFLYQHGFVGLEIRDELNRRHLHLVENIKKENYSGAYDDWLEIWYLIQDETSLPSLYTVGPYEDDTSYENWLNTTKARSLLHVGNLTFTYYSTDVHEKLKAEMPKPATHYLEIMLKAKIPVLIYSGNLDVACLTTSTDCMLNSLEWWGAEGFRKAKRTAWFHDGVLAGNFKHFGDLYFVVIKDAGHYVPTYKSEQMIQVINSMNFLGDPVSGLNTTYPE